MGALVVSPAVQRVRVMVIAVTLAGLVTVTGCGGGGGRLDPTPSDSSRPASPRSASPIPIDGYSLRAFGVRNGPAQFSVPRGAVASTIVDQANNVVLVLSEPAPNAVAGYLRQTLPGAGFRITDADPSDTTFTFDGQGWSGTYTTGDGVSAVLLRPR